MAVADVDNDGDLDLLTSRGGDNAVAVNLNDTFLPKLTSISPTSGPAGSFVGLTGTTLTSTTTITFAGTSNNTVTSGFFVNPAGTGIFSIVVPAGAQTGPVTVTTAYGTSNGVTFTVTHAPTDLTLTPTSVAENAGANAGVGAFTTTDPDAGDTFTYSLVSGASDTDNAAFDVVNDDLRLLASADFETRNTYAIRVRTTDQTGLFTEQTFTISVANVNEAPTALALSNATIAENTGANVVVGSLSTTDPDANDTFTYALVSGAGSTDNALVNLNGDEVRITADPDFETKASYAIRVRVTDAGGLFFERAFTLTITDVNETPANDTPVNIFLSNADVAENAANAVVGLLTTADGDPADTHTYTLVSGTGSTGNPAFQIVGDQLRVGSTALDFETQSSYSVRIRSTDSGAGNLFCEKAFTITVTDVAEALTVSAAQTVPAGQYTTLTVTGTGIATLGGPVQVNAAVVVQTGGVLNTNCQPLTGAGDFALQAGATLSICAPQGISASGATGAVQLTGTRAFALDAAYRYVGTAAQVTGTGLPGTVRELETANAAGVTMTQPVTVTRVLRLTSGTLTTNGETLTLRSTATRTAYAVHAGGTTSGGVTVQRYVGGPAAVSYHHLASPVQAAPISDLATAGFAPRVSPAYNALPTPTLPASQQPNVFGYDEARGGAANANFIDGYYSPASLGGTLTPGRGYAVAIPGGKTPDFVGALTSGPVNVPLTLTGDPATNGKAGWQLLGNPYPQPLDWDLFTAPAGLDAAVYVWYSTGGNSGAYRTRNASGLGNLTDGLIGLGQAFFVRTTAPTTFSFTNVLRVEENVALGRQPLAATPRLTLTLAQAGAPADQHDEVTLYEQPGATAGYDGAFDAVRPGRNVGVPTLSALIGGQEAMISAVPEASLTAGTTVELLLDLPAAGTYTLAIGELVSLDGAALLDRTTNTRYDLATQPIVSFTSTAGESRGRFALVFGQRPTGTGAEATASSFTLAPNPAHGVVRLCGAAAETATLLDATGRTVRTWLLVPGTTADLSLTGLPSGVYSVRVGTASRRLVVE